MTDIGKLLHNLPRHVGVAFDLQLAGIDIAARQHEICSTSAQSSSLAISRSTCGSSCRMVFSANSRGGTSGSHRQSFLRKLRSQETVKPADLAVWAACSATWAAVSLMAGVMPVIWNHPASSKMASQSYDSAGVRPTEESIPVVNDLAGTLIGPTFQEVETQSTDIGADDVTRFRRPAHGARQGRRRPSRDAAEP